MTSKKYSPAIRITTGLLGFGGVAAIAFEAFQEGGMRLDLISYLMLFAKLYVAYIFFWVAFFGKSPLAFLDKSSNDP